MKKEKEVKKITVSGILSWILGIIFGLAGLGALFSLYILSGIMLLIMSAVLLPPMNKLFKEKTNFELSRWVKIAVIIIGFIIIGIGQPEITTQEHIKQIEIATQQETVKEPEVTQEKPKETPTAPPISTPTVTKPEYDLEMTMEEIVNTFSGLSDIQQEEKMKEFKGKRIKTSIYASKINKASLSTQYVVLEMYEYPYNLLPYAKAFFPNEEKDNLLKVNIGDTIIFSGEFVSYRGGGLTSTVEFTKSKFIGIKKE